MTITLMALYRRPNDEQAFLAHYNDVHMPLVRQTPHLIETRLRRVTEALAGETELFLIAEMDYPDREAFAPLEHRFQKRYAISV